MAAEIRVPGLGESVTEATVAKWLKQPGEAVERDEPVVELETDKVTLEVPAPQAGILGEIRAAAGSNVPVGAVLGMIADGAAVGSPHPNPPPQAGEGRRANVSARQPSPACGGGKGGGFGGSRYGDRAGACRSGGPQARRREWRRCRGAHALGPRRTSPPRPT